MLRGSTLASRSLWSSGSVLLQILFVHNETYDKQRNDKENDTDNVNVVDH